MEPMPLHVPSSYSPLLETWIRGMAPHAVFLLVFNALVPFSLAQSFTVPSYWRKPTSNHSRQELLQLVDGVLNTITHSLNVTTGQFIGLQPLQSASMVSALSIGDALNGSTTNEGVVRESLSSVFTLTPNITSIQTVTPQTNDNPAIWGLAALDAYKAYNDTQFFSYADSIWTQLNEYMVTLDQAALVSATHPMRTINFPGSCNQISNAGGIFYLSGSTNDTTVDGQSTATFMALSAHLYEQTLHPQYLSAATMSANFVLDQLTNGNVILDSMLLETCSKSTTLWTSNSAYAIYGLSALASKNVSYAPRLSQLVSTVVPDLQWTNSSDGVNIEGPPDAERAKLNGPHVALKGIFIRSLYQAYARIESDSLEATLLRSYINVQLNALVDLATTPGANQYSPRWEGPPLSGLLLQGQLAAVDVLYSSLGLVKSQNASTNTSTGATDTSPLPGVTATGISQAAGNVHRISPGAVGGIVAGITTLLLIIAAALFIVKRKRLQGNPSVVLETTARPYTPPIVERRMALSCGHSSDRLIIPPSKHSRSDPSGMEGTDSIPGPSTSDIFATDPMASPYFSQPQAHRGEEGYPAGERPYVMNLVASPALIDHLNRFIPPESPIGYAQDEPPRYVR